MLSPPHGAWLAAPTPSKPQWWAGCSWCSFWVWTGSVPMQGDRGCPCRDTCKVRWATQPSGGRAELWMPPSNHSGRNEGARPLLPRERTGLAGWPLWRGRATPEGASHADSTGHHCGPTRAQCVGLQRAEKLLCCRLVEEWVLGEKNFSVLPAFLLTSQGAPFLCLLALKDLDFAALWIGTQSSGFS